MNKIFTLTRNLCTILDGVRCDQLHHGDPNSDPKGCGRKSERV